MIPHIIITRYNEGLFSDNPFKIENPDGWMWDRLQYFKETVNGMNEQEGDFTWFITLDEGTPDHWIDKIEELTSGLPCIICSRFDLKPMIKELFIDYEYLATSRLDNDDYYNYGFIPQIQKRFEPKEKIIDTKGFQYDIINNKYYDDGRIHPNSPFITLISKDKIVLDFEHSKAHEKFPAERLPDALWTQVLHDNNLANKIKGVEIGKDN